jgi:DnaK suppressor protein
MEAEVFWLSTVRPDGRPHVTPLISVRSALLRYGGGMDAERARELLAAERTRIERAIAQLRHADSGEVGDIADPGNLGSELYQDELDQGLADELREKLAAVERAEARLAAGTYGLSVVSGKPIPDERLEAIPTAERTVEEEAR